MHTISLYINETVNTIEADGLRQEMMATPHVRNVELRADKPHDMLVEFDEHHDVPMNVLGILKSHGLHADIVGC